MKATLFTVVCLMGSVITAPNLQGQLNTQSVLNYNPQPVSATTNAFSRNVPNVFGILEDPNCLQTSIQGCIKCSYRYLLQSGKCTKIQDECETYNEEGCQSCYAGYYLSSGFCYQGDPLCQESNSQGLCTECYMEYININGKCYIQSNWDFSKPGSIPTDQLCRKWSGQQCHTCEAGTFMSKKTGKCTIKDPFCFEFSEKLEKCVICQRGFELNYSQVCVRTQWIFFSFINLDYLILTNTLLFIWAPMIKKTNIIGRMSILNRKGKLSFNYIFSYIWGTPKRPHLGILQFYFF